MCFSRIGDDGYGCCHPYKMERYPRYQEKDLFEETADKACKFAVGAFVGAVILSEPAVLPALAIGATMMAAPILAAGTMVAATAALVAVPIVMTGAVVAGTMAMVAATVTLAAAPVLLPLYLMGEVLSSF